MLLDLVEVEREEQDEDDGRSHVDDLRGDDCPILHIITVFKGSVEHNINACYR